MKKVIITTGVPYSVLIGPELLTDTGGLMREYMEPADVMVVTDEHVYPIYGEIVLNSLKSCGFHSSVHIIKSGEQYKNSTTLLGIIERMSEEHLTRSSVVVALGGGVVGDVAGFAAAIYRRGVRYVQIPTTLLAAVDSSVGGKTAVDTPSGKNQIGAFHQPSLVITDTTAFNTLPPQIYRDGFAEVIKYGIILDREFFDGLKRSDMPMEEVVCRCVELKNSVVSEDELDRGRRAILNFGHTVGHAMEKLSNYTVTHGEAVAKGMFRAAKIGAALGYEDLTEQISSILTAYKFDLACRWNGEELYDAALSDKKYKNGRFAFILPEQIGRCRVRLMEGSELKSQLIATE